MSQLRKFRVVIVMPDGSRGEHEGSYEDGFAAVIAAMETFPDARRISAKELS